MTNAAEELLGAVSAIRRALHPLFRPPSSCRPSREPSSSSFASCGAVPARRSPMRRSSYGSRRTPCGRTLVGQLAEAGIVARAVDATDRRVARLTLTPTIARKVDAWRDRRFEALGGGARGFDR